jgi:hypothetical protein
MNTPKLSLPASIVIAALMIATAMWQMSEKNRYAISSVALGGSLGSFPYLCDSKTGKVWLLAGDKIHEPNKPLFVPRHK